MISKAFGINKTTRTGLEKPKIAKTSNQAAKITFDCLAALNFNRINRDFDYFRENKTRQMNKVAA